MMGYPEVKPCWAPGAADYLASILTGEEIGFEWGGGDSSIWLLPKVFQLTVMETDKKWLDYIDKHTDRANCLLVHRNFEDPDYVTYEGLRRPNLWLIDGYRRIDCLELVESKADHGDIVVMDDALDYAEHLLDKVEFGRIERFAMPHPHAGKPCVSRLSKIYRNTVRTHAPATKETFIWTV